MMKKQVKHGSDGISQSAVIVGSGILAAKLNGLQSFCKSHFRWSCLCLCCFSSAHNTFLSSLPRLHLCSWAPVRLTRDIVLLLLLSLSLSISQDLFIGKVQLQKEEKERERELPLLISQAQAGSWKDVEQPGQNLSPYGMPMPQVDDQPETPPPETCSPTWA